MLKPRVIPCLLLRKGALVKTVRFGESKYIGDVLNAVRIFNEKEADELIVLDIDATAERRPPDFVLIEQIARECRMPFCYGGGVKTAEQARRLVSLGAEKVAIGSGIFETPNLVRQVSSEVGSQSAVVVLDYRKKRFFGGHEVFYQNGTKASGCDPVELAVEMQAQGAGEILLNSIDRDGMMEGYDLELAKRVRHAVDIPVTVLGGAGRLEHLNELFQKAGLVGAAAGSLFVYKGSYKAVLINYPRLII